jgi:hypothetical protein
MIDHRSDPYWRVPSIAFFRHDRRFRLSRPLSQVPLTARLTTLRRVRETKHQDNTFDTRVTVHRLSENLAGHSDPYCFDVILISSKIRICVLYLHRFSKTRLWMKHVREEPMERQKKMNQEDCKPLL